MSSIQSISGVKRSAEEPAEDPTLNKCRAWAKNRAAYKALIEEKEEMESRHQRESKAMNEKLEQNKREINDAGWGTHKHIIGITREGQSENGGFPEIVDFVDFEDNPKNLTLIKFSLDYHPKELSTADTFCPKSEWMKYVEDQLSLAVANNDVLTMNQFIIKYNY
jgi:hypothetical protein